MRSLEDHLSPHELASLPDSLAALAAAGPEQQQLSQHLRQCEVCKNLAQIHWSLGNLPPRGASFARKDCPAREVWLECATGLRAGDVDTLLSHASTCAACAGELKEAMILMDETGAEVAEQDLASATPAWQREMGRKLAELSAQAGIPEQSPRTGKVIAWKPTRVQGTRLWGGLAAGLALAMVMITGLWVRSSHSDARLLAIAYDRQRLTELRIPGGHDVPLAPFTRGSGSHEREPRELHELSARVDANLESSPQSPYWHQMLGRVGILRHDPRAALDDFRLAESEAVTANQQLPGILEDLGDALQEKGEITGDPNYYREAAENYTLQLADHPADIAVLYFNRALCWEHTGLTQNALDDYRSALAVERDPQWRRLIQAKIDALAAHATVSQTDGYEAALVLALEKLLPQWEGSDEVRSEVRRTAALGLAHHDHWLGDWIASAHTVTTQQADLHVSSAIAAAHAGHYQDLQTEAQKALALYARARNAPGETRARQLQVYALQRLGLARDCRDGAAKLAVGQALKWYPGIHAQLLIDEGGCEGRLEDYGSSLHHFREAEAVSLAARLPFANLTAIASEAELLTASGMDSAAWKRDATGVDGCERLGCGTRSEYSMLYNMVVIAQHLGEDHVAALLMRTAVRLSAATGNPVANAFAFETLATLEGKVGDYAGASRDFADAFNIAHRAGGKIAPLYQAVWQTDQAQLLSRLGDPAAALQLLASCTPVLLASDYTPGRISAYRELSTAELASGRTSDALENSRLAVAEAERSLSSLHSTLEKEQWTRDNADVYADLVNVYLKRGDSNAALATWERYRAAPFLGRTAIATAASDAPANEVIVIARVKESYVGWLARTRPLVAERTVVLGDRQQLLTLAATLYRLCTDRNSSIDDLHTLGTGLYRSLLGPLDSQANRGRHLWIDLDPSLQTIPLLALTTDSHDWLANQAQVTLLAPWWSIAEPASLEEPALDPSLRILIVNAFTGDEATGSEAAEVARQFHASVLISGPEATQSAVLRALPSAELFHFSGHASPGDEAELIVAPGGTPNAGGLTPPALSSLRLAACRVAVLAACNTSSADPGQVEPPPDLRNALLQAGARTVIASNWDVDNASTRALMLAFYKQAGPRASPSLALQLAQQSIASTAAWRHPFYWAAFQSFTQ